MTRKILFTSTLILLVLIASGCNLPRRSQSSPTPDIVATQVATILAAMPTTDLQASLTPQPATPTTQATSSTPTPSTTPTVSTDDPRSQLGEPTYRDTFEKAGLWGLDEPYDDGHTRIEIQNNRLVLTSYFAEGWMGWRTTFAKSGNTYIEGSFSTGSCSGGDQYGLLFRSNEDTGGDFFAITCDGRYSLSHFDGSQFSSLVNLKEAPAIHSGSNQTNRLGVWLEGNKIRLYVNGALLTETTDDQLSGQGNFGAFIAGLKTANFSVSLSEFDYWELK